MRIVEVDLWEGEEIVPLLPPEGVDELSEDNETLEEEKFNLFSEDNKPEWAYTKTYKRVIIHVDNNKIKFYSIEDLSTDEDLNKLEGFSKTSKNIWEANRSSVNAFILRHIIKSIHGGLSSKEDVKALATLADNAVDPHVRISDDKTTIEISAPQVWVYTDVLRKLSAYYRRTGIYSLQIGKLLDFQSLCENMDERFPPFRVDDDVYGLVNDPIEGFDGTLDSLRFVDIEELNVIRANKQSNDQLRKSEKTLAEKMRESGYATLHDLIMTIPRKYIFKNESQDLKDLEEGETATIVGKIDSSGEFGNPRTRASGIYFMIKTEGGNNLRVSFFNQRWLLTRFKTGDEVIVTGKFGYFNLKPQISGISIDHMEDAELLPVVPVYKQQPSKGITTKLILSAIRELIARSGADISMPEYFEPDNKMPTGEAFNELHFPSSPEHHEACMDTLAFYEMVSMQLVLQESRKNQVSHQGIKMEESDSALQQKAIESLPFTLTNAQSQALEKINHSLAGSEPSSTLVNADVGSGKSIIAFLSCLRAAESGYQSAIVGPTDVLARQLYAGLEKAVAPLGDDVSIALITGSMKVKEKNAIYKKVADGEIDIVVGTLSLVKTKMKYNNLGLIVIDEQQKFSAEDRSRLLSSREDERVPDLIQQTATPIPRSIAQSFFGDVDMIILDEKPPGRIPILTEWIQESPTQIINEKDHPMWQDIIDEAKAGNQTFIIAPMVKESDKIDAASVEKAYESINNGVLSSINVGYVHGKMKPDDQMEAMTKFRNKEYDVLVASTVVEVGVDIPDATRVIVLSADRLGSASLHQIRGRVGRNQKPSKCYLVSIGNTKNSQKRLQNIVDHADGFDVAQADMENRGTGTVFGTEQSGNSEMLFADLLTHKHLIDETVESAKRILNSENREQALKDASQLFISKGRLL